MRATIELLVTLIVEAPTRRRMQQVTSEWAKDVQGYGIVNWHGGLDSRADVRRIRRSRPHIVKRITRST